MNLDGTMSTNDMKAKLSTCEWLKIVQYKGYDIFSCSKHDFILEDDIHNCSYCDEREMAKFNPRFKEGSLVDISFKGIVTEILPGSREDDTFYRVFIPDTCAVKQIKSCNVSERDKA